jgi:hypothetical protein
VKALSGGVVWVTEDDPIESTIKSAACFQCASGTVDVYEPFGVSLPTLLGILPALLGLSPASGRWSYARYGTRPSPGLPPRSTRVVPKSHESLVNFDVFSFPAELVTTGATNTPVEAIGIKRFAAT